MNSIKANILVETKEKLAQCKEVLKNLSPVYFMGAGLQFVSLIARQVLMEATSEAGVTDNQLGWEQNVEDAGWLFKHQREVERFAQYCA
jgi:hypothetical protein